MKIPKVIGNKTVLDAVKKVTEKKINSEISLSDSFTQVDPEDLEEMNIKAVAQSMILETSQITDYDRTPSFHSLGEEKPGLIIEKLEGFDINSNKKKYKNALSMEKLDELDLSVLETNHLKATLEIERQENLHIKPLEKKTGSKAKKILVNNPSNFGWSESLTLGVLGALILTKKMMFRKYFSTF